MSDAPTQYVQKVRDCIEANYAAKNAGTGHDEPEARIVVLHGNVEGRTVVRFDGTGGCTVADQYWNNYDNAPGIWEDEYDGHVQLDRDESDALRLALNAEHDRNHQDKVE